MKFSTPILLAILTTSTVVGAAPSTITQSTSDFTGLVKKSDISNALSIIEELGQLNQKRELVEDENELFELSKRADSLLSQLLTSLANSGIIGDVWNFLTTDSTLRTTVVALIKKAVQGAITYGPSLIKAVYNSGYIQKFLTYIYNDASLRSTLLSVAKTIFSSGLNLLKAFLSTKTSSTTTTATAAATTIKTTAAATTTTKAAAKREDLELEFDPEMYFDKRDLLTVAETVYTAIKNTGIVQSLVLKALADPQASISFLTSALKNGLVLAEDVYLWAKSSGVLSSAISWIEKDGLTYAKDIAEFFGNLIVSGTVSVSQIDNASTSAAASTTTKSTAAATTTTKATTAATTTTTTKTTAIATTLVRRRLY